MRKATREGKVAHGPNSATRWLLLCGAASGALHVAVYLAQRQIHRGPDGGELTFAGGLLLYALATFGLFGVYRRVVQGCARGWIATARDRRLAIVIPVVFNIALLPTLPSLSIDLYSYLAHGYVHTGLGENPYLVGARAVAGTPFGHEIAEYGWQPVHRVTPYGPILSLVESAVVSASGSVRIQMLLFKAITTMAGLASAALIWIILGRVWPQHQLLGTVTFLWNPTVIWEIAGEAHNDAVMILFTLAAVGLILNERLIAGIIAMALAVLTKYIPVMLVPLCAAYAWATNAPRRLFARAVVGAVIAAALTVVLFLPFWAGLQTFRGVRVNGAPGSTGSTPTVVLEVLERISPHTDWQGFMWGVVTLALLICVGVQVRRVRDAAGLLRAAAVVWLVYTLLISPTYWPWYATTVVALLALVPEHRSLTMALVVSFSARLAAPLTMVYVHGVISRPLFFGLVWIIGSGVPLLVLVLPRFSAIIGALHPAVRRN